MNLTNNLFQEKIKKEIAFTEESSDEDEEMKEKEQDIIDIQDSPEEKENDENEPGIQSENRGIERSSSAISEDIAT